MSSYIPTPDYGYSAPALAIPQPDYTYQRFAAPTSLIPPPDYTEGRPYDPKIDYDRTIRYPQSRNSNRRSMPAFNNVIYSNENQKSHHDNIPSPVKVDGRQERVPRDNVFADNQRHSYVPRMPGDNFIAHSYLEDKDKIKPSDIKHKSIRSHIRNIGVPVLPGMTSDSVPNDEFVDISPAFLRHLENHKNFDTLKSLRSCHLCVMMAKEGLIDIDTGALLNNLPTVAPTKIRKDVRDLFEQQQDDEPWIRTRRSYLERHEGEMSVDFGEKIQVIRREGTHALCKRRDGTLGWLPAYVVQQ